MDKAELLKVLGMTNVKKQTFLIYKYGGIEPTESLADLAFRLRDEVCKTESGCERYYAALEDIYKHRKIQKQCQSFNAWMTYRIAPIDMIIAALIAKGEQDERN